MREKAAAVESGCVTARLLEALVRLVQARARVELREVATAEDAADVIDLMRATLLDELASGLQQLPVSNGRGGKEVNFSSVTWARRMIDNF